MRWWCDSREDREECCNTQPYCPHFYSHWKVSCKIFKHILIIIQKSKPKWGEQSRPRVLRPLWSGCSQAAGEGPAEGPPLRCFFTDLKVMLSPALSSTQLREAPASHHLHRCFLPWATIQSPPGGLRSPSLFLPEDRNREGMNDNTGGTARPVTLPGRSFPDLTLFLSF